MRCVDCSQYFLNEFGATAPAERDTEKVVLTVPRTVGQGFKALVFQIKDTTIYCRRAGSPINVSNMVDTFNIYIKRTLIFAVSLNVWDEKEKNDKQWIHVRPFWGQKYMLQKPTITAQQ